jgi:signal peptidase II
MMRKRIFSTGLWWGWIAVLILLLDQGTKYLAQHYLSLHDPLYVLPFLNFTLAYNTGAAFSFLQSASGWQNILLGIFALIVSCIIVCWLYRLSAKEYWIAIALSFVIGGALGNLWDRFSYNHVIDFFHFHIGTWSWPIFNVADSAICIGAGMLFFYWSRQPK